MVVSTSGSVAAPPLLLLLADGESRSAASLARLSGLTRAAVAREIQRLRALGIGVQAIAGRGYRLPHPVELLEAKRLLPELSVRSAQQLRELRVLFEVDSTSSYLLSAPPPAVGMADVCACELQHAGRGRLGRRWIAPFGSGLTISLSWTFAGAARALPTLSLGAGVAVTRALARAGAAGIALKWPNDIWLQDRKVGGILVEVRTEAGGTIGGMTGTTGGTSHTDGPVRVVIGVGLNVFLPAAARLAIEATGARVAAVADACVARPSRNAIAGGLIDELLSMLSAFERSGFAALWDDWSALDALRGRAVRVHQGDKITAGTARGADADGALLVESGGRLCRFVSGEASLRLTEGEQ